MFSLYTKTNIMPTSGKSDVWLRAPVSACQMILNRDAHCTLTWLRYDRRAYPRHQPACKRHRESGGGLLRQIRQQAIRKICREEGDERPQVE